MMCEKCFGDMFFVGDEEGGFFQCQECGERSEYYQQLDLLDLIYFCCYS